MEFAMERRQFPQQASLGVAAAALAATPSVAGAAAATPDWDKATKLVESAGALAFGSDNVLFVGDTKGAEVHAFQLFPSAFAPQTNVSLGNAQTFEGCDLVGGIDRKLAALMGTSPDQIVINDMVAHRPSRQIFKSFSKSFRVTEAIREPIDPGRWTVNLPASGTRQALVLNFPRPLDHALLSHMIRVVDPDQQSIVGLIELDRQEKRWVFTPSSAWVAGRSQCLLDG
jgi:hypothetical protein